MLRSSTICAEQGACFVQMAREIEVLGAGHGLSDAVVVVADAVVADKIVLARTLVVSRVSAWMARGAPAPIYITNSSASDPAVAFAPTVAPAEVRLLRIGGDGSRAVADAVVILVAIKENSLSSSVSVHAAPSTALTVVVEGTDDAMPRRADLLVSEIFYSALLGESALLAFAHARANLLETGATVIPTKTRLCAQLIPSALFRSFHNLGESFPFHCAEIGSACAGAATGMPVNATALVDNYTLLTVSFTLFDFNLEIDESLEQRAAYSVPRIASGRVDDALVSWDLYLVSDGSICYPTAPGAEPWKDHWLPAVHALPDCPVHSDKADEIEIVAGHDAARVWLSAESLARGPAACAQLQHSRSFVPQSSIPADTSEFLSTALVNTALHAVPVDSRVVHSVLDGVLSTEADALREVIETDWVETLFTAVDTALESPFPPTRNAALRSAVAALRGLAPHLSAPHLLALTRRLVSLHRANIASLDERFILALAACIAAAAPLRACSKEAEAVCTNLVGKALAHVANIISATAPVSHNASMLGLIFCIGLACVTAAPSHVRPRITMLMGLLEDAGFQSPSASTRRTAVTLAARLLASRSTKARRVEKMVRSAGSQRHLS